MFQSNNSSQNPHLSGNSRNQSSIVQPDHQITDEIGNFSGAVERCLRNFILGKKIGQGTFSKVCIAKHKLTNQQVAIKIIEKAKIQNQADQIRLSREMKIMRKVRHPNIAQLYQIIQTSKYIYLVMEYAARGQLFDHIISHQKLTQFQASKFLLQLTDAIEYLHQLGITHRDLKPQNLLLDHKFNIKVTDFGLSNIYPAGQMLQTACGSPSYACPQMLNGKPYDGLKADIWSIGIVLYAMCFGYLPFDNPNLSQLYKSIKSGSFEIPEFASTKLRDLLQRILEVDPDRRATISQIRKHPYCEFSIPSKNACSSIPGIVIGLSDIPFQNSIEAEMKNQLGINTQHLREEIKKNKHNQNTCTYYLLLQRSLRQRNQSLTNYYSSKYNTINRYALIQKVKANYDKMMQNKMEIKKFHAVQQQIRRKNMQVQQKFTSQTKKNSDKKKAAKQQNKSGEKKIVHSTQYNSKQKIILKQNQNDEDQNYLSSHMKHFAPNNTKEKLHETTKKKKQPPKNRNISKSQEKSKTNTKSISRSKNQSRSNSKNKHMSKQKKYRNSEIKRAQKKFKKYNLTSNYLEVPDQNIEANLGRKINGLKYKSDKKGNEESSKKKKRVKTLQKQQKSKRRNKSMPHGIKLKF